MCSGTLCPHAPPCHPGIARQRNIRDPGRMDTGAESWPWVPALGLTPEAGMTVLRARPVRSGRNVLWHTLPSCPALSSRNCAPAQYPGPRANGYWCGILALGPGSRADARGRDDSAAGATRSLRSQCALAHSALMPRPVIPELRASAISGTQGEWILVRNLGPGSRLSG